MLKTVTFAVPPRKRATTAPAQRLNPYYSTPWNLNPTPITSFDEAKPDGIAKTAIIKPEFSGEAAKNKISGPADGGEKTGAATKNGNWDVTSVPGRKSEEVKSSSVTNHGNLSLQEGATRTKSAGGAARKSPVERAEKQRIISAKGSKGKISSNIEVMHMTRHCRDQSNMATHSNVRTIKHDVAKLRVQLVKLEEEIKHMTRGRGLLAVGIQEMRRSLSTNQRSISTFQKRSKNRTEVGGVLRSCSE